MLAPGGRLVYATCTVTRSENRDVIARVSARHSRMRQSCRPRRGRAGRDFGEADECGRQILPGEAGADGFYYAALTKQ
jgi:16S rRNA (cytosine967-C5)-methyltransferase